MVTAANDYKTDWLLPIGGVRLDCFKQSSLFDFVKQLSVFATLALARGGSAPSR
jgi:hypothetical protein